MKYIIDKQNHINFKTVEAGRLFPRAYAIPHTKLKDAKCADYKTERYNSDVVEVLSGEWEFKYYKKFSKLPDTLDTSRIKFDTVNIPSTWQRTGYEEPAYINCPYGFDPIALGLPEKQGVKPPELPEDFPCGVYRKFINIDKKKDAYIINFLGVASCLNLYVNGIFVGYGEGSHNPYEFDITDYLKEGENELLAVVYKWCSGSYLEAQDMFRENGIFRDVLLYSYNKSYINDFQAIPVKKGKKYTLNVNAQIKGVTKNTSVKASLYDGKTLVAEDSADGSKDSSITLKNLQVEEWSAEIPRLYELYITLYSGKSEVMTIRQYIGFKNIEIKDAVFYFNGKKIKFKGVNHHDTHETKGYAINFADYEKDIRLMKEYNVNAVRTSHYPPDPMLLDLCDHYGLYVVDEADIETHGLYSLGCDPTAISNDLKWAPRYMDRVRRMYYRDRSHTCITMWSLGNEAEGYKCQDKCYKILKEFGTKIPVHYESVSHTKRQHYDVYSEMYTHQDDMKKIGNGTRGKSYKEVPFFLCEYAHAMGVGPGALEEYMQIFFSNDIFMGGCIWEWADHAVLHDGSDKYKYQYTYGGDHGEKLHDGNFCVDGLFYPDRTPHTGAIEMKTCYRPLRVRKLSGNKLTIVNTNRFLSSDGIEVYWELQENGEVKNCGTFPTNIAPEKDATYKLDLPKVDYSKNTYLNITYLKGDFEVATEQLTLSEAPFIQPNLEMGKVSVSSDGEKITVKFDNGSVEFCEETGEMLTYKANGVSVLNKEPVSHKGFLLNISRAFTDNDRPKIDHYNRHNISSPKIVLEDLSAEVKSGVASVSEYLSVYGKEDVLFNANVLYIIGANGVIDIEVDVAPCEGSKEHIDDIPALGLTFEADKKFSTIEYFGRGELENYNDFNAHAPIGLYRAEVAEEHEAYIRPQDNFNHSDVSYLKLLSDKGEEILIYSDKRFDFSVHNYTQELLQKANHREDIYDQKTTFVTINGLTRGIGTGSCGPWTLPEYSIDSSKELSFNVVIAPSKKEK
ncbi:MAG: glycoside hydrolase family 2 TIM barrel-domain containing protein [Acutalibacteraceae bacterium]